MIFFEGKINPPRNQHLKEGIKPIFGCIYDRNNMDKESQYFFDNFKKDAEFVNFYSKKEELLEKKFKNSGKETYVISEINEKNKYSHEYFNCTGVVASGINKKTGKTVSFLSHQNPGFFVENKEERLNFKNHLIESLRQLKQQCVLGTIDVVIFGGQKEKVTFNTPDDNFVRGLDDLDESIFRKEEFDTYKDSIRYLNFFISNEIGFSPVVISGPSGNFDDEYHPLDIYFENKNRRLHLVRPKQDSLNNQSFVADNIGIEKQIKKLKENESNKE